MVDKNDLPFPVRFNSFKHHRNYALKIVDGLSAEEIVDLLDPLANNYIDIYTGALTPKDIGDAVISILKSNKALGFEAFTGWVEKKKDTGKLNWTMNQNGLSGKAMTPNAISTFILPGPAGLPCGLKVRP